MPRGKMSAEQLESFREKRAVNAEIRRQILAQLVWMFVPRGRPKPWKEVAEDAVEFYRNGSNWGEEDPFLQDHDDGFISVSGIMGHRGDIRKVLAGEGSFIIPVRGQGIRRPASRREISEYFDDYGNVVESMAENYNFLAEEAKAQKNLDVPRFNLRLLPEPEDNDNE